MTLQAGVVAGFAADLARTTTPGTRFGLSSSALLQGLQFEIAQFLYDIQMELSDGSAILVQCEARPTLSAAPEDHGRAGRVGPHLVTGDRRPSGLRPPGPPRQPPQHLPVVRDWTA